MEKKMTAVDFFEGTLLDLLKDPRGTEVLKKINKSYAFEVTGEGGGVWTVELMPNGKVYRGKKGKPAATLSCDADTALELFKNPGNAMSFYSSGKLKVDGVWAALSLKALKDIKI